MQQFTSEYNVSDPTKWDEHLKLIGFCNLIKGSVLFRDLPGVFQPWDNALLLYTGHPKKFRGIFFGCPVLNLLYRFNRYIELYRTTVIWD